MKQSLVALVAGLTLGTAWPAWAGPDWQAIEAARKAKRATSSNTGAATCASGSREARSSASGRGPRAQAMPRQNRPRGAASSQACA